MSTTTDFFDAVRAGDLARMEALLDDDPALARAATDAGVSVVLWAMYHGRTQAVERLIATGVELDLFEAAAVGHLERVASLVQERPSRVDAHTPDGFSPLGLAAFFGRADVLSLLLERGANPNAASRNPMRVTPLHSAVAHRQAEVSLRMVKALLQHGADSKVRQQGGWTPLHQAAAHGRMDLVDLLLGYGADPSVESEDGGTPARKAAEAGHPEVAERLRRVVPGRRLDRWKREAERGGLRSSAPVCLHARCMPGRGSFPLHSGAGVIRFKLPQIFSPFRPRRTWLGAPGSRGPSLLPF